MDERPLLVLVSGLPASGKTTLARHVARALGLPLLSRDAITETLTDALSRRSREVSQASFGVFLRLIDEQIETGLGAVAETNFHRGVAELTVLDLAIRARVALVHCRCPRDLAIRRFAERHQRAPRHRCFEDGERLARVLHGEADPAWEQAEPLDLPVPTLVVDTSDGYAPDLAAIVAFARSA